MACSVHEVSIRNVINSILYMSRMMPLEYIDPSYSIIRLLTITIIVSHSRCSTGNSANILTRRLNMSVPDVLHDLELLPGRFIGQGKPAFIIAEIGQNHNGKSST